MTEVELPSWMDHQGAPKVRVLYHKGEKYGIKGSHKEFDTLYDACDYVNSRKEQVDLELIDGADNGLFISDGGRMFFTKLDYAEMDKEIYNEFLNKTDKEYRENPEHPAIVFNWLQNHPAFYHRVNEAVPYHWETSDGLHDMSINSYYDPEDGWYFLLEHGPWEGEGRFGRRYLDWRMVVSKPSFDEAIIELARRVDKIYTPEGVERDQSEIDIPKPQWVKDLEDRSYDFLD